MNKLSKEKRDRVLLIALGAAVISAAIWHWLISEQNSGLEKYQQSILDAQSKIHKADLLVRRAAGIDADLRTLRQELGEAEARMIPAEQLNGNKWLQDKLVNFAKGRYDITLLRLSKDPVIGKQFLPLPKFPYSAAAYDIELRAYYHEFGKFLADFENQFPYASVFQFQMWPLATPKEASGPVADTPEELLEGPEREQLRITMRIVLLFKPIGSS